MVPVRRRQCYPITNPSKRFRGSKGIVVLHLLRVTIIISDYHRLKLRKQKGNRKRESGLGLKMEKKLPRERKETSLPIFIKKRCYSILIERVYRV